VALAKKATCLLTTAGTDHTAELLAFSLEA
jgi:hypothetical protein